MTDTAPDPGALVAMMPFAGLLGVVVDEASAERVVARVEHRAELCTAGGLMHGGALMTLADTAGALCAFLGLPDGATTATTSSHTSLFRAARAGTLTRDGPGAAPRADVGRRADRRRRRRGPPGQPDDAEPGGAGAPVTPGAG